jgi:tetratricopeptide (TPR) repeat protein
MNLQRKRVATAVRVRELVDAAFATRYQDMRAMLKLSSRAVALAEEKLHELPPDLVVAAWTQYGNAFRIAGRYREAEKALDRAAALPASDLATKINLLEITANLHRSTGRFESAVRLLNEVIVAQRGSGDPNGAARTYNLLGMTYLDSEDLQLALRAYKTALDLFDADAPLEVVASTGHNILEILLAQGRLGAAASVLVILEPFYRRLTSTRLSAKAEWARARLCRELKQFSAAQMAYERAYTLLSTDSLAPELAELAKEMSALPPPS